MMLGRLSLLTLLSVNLNRFISKDFSTFLIATTFVPLKYIYFFTGFYFTTASVMCIIALFIAKAKTDI